MFAGYIHGRPRSADTSVGRGDIHDASTPLREHDAQLMLHTQQDTQDVRIEGGRIALRGLLRYETTRPFGSSIVDCDVQPSKMLDRLIDEIADIIVGPHVCSDEFCLSSERP